MKDRTTLARWTPRRLLSLLMALIMTLSLLPTAALAAPGDYTLNVTGAPGQLITQQESADITATLTDNTTVTSPVDVRLKVTVTPATTGAEIKRYDTATSTYVPTPDYLDNGTTYLSVSSGSPVSAAFKLSFSAAGSYTVTVEAFSVGAAGTETLLVSETLPITVKNAIGTLTADPDNLEAGQPFTVTAMTNVDNGKILFKYGTQFETVNVLSMGDGTGYARHTFIAEATASGSGANAISAKIFDVLGVPPAEETAALTVAAAATYHTVTFLAGAADAYIPFVATATVKGGDNYTIPTDKPTRKGYTFGGWTDGTNTYLAGGSITGVTKDIVLSAMWTATPVTIEITKDTADVTVFPPPTSGSTTSTLPGAIGKTANFNVTVPAKYDTASMIVQAGIYGGEHQYLVPESQSIDSTTGAVTFHYQFVVKENIVVDDGGVLKVPIHVGAVTEKTFTVMMPTGHFNAEITGATPAPPVPPATGVGSTVADDKKSASIVYGGGYTFTVTPKQGYDVEVYVNGVAKTAGTDGKYTVTDVTGPQSVVVVESAIPNYNVTFTVPLSGEFFTQSVARGKTATKPGVDPAREGYKFDGWYTAAEYNTPGGTKFDFDTLINENTVLYGKLTPKTYPITYDLNSGTDATNPATITAQTKTHGLAEKLSMTVPTRVGYTFLGWGTTDKATAASYQPGDMYSVDGDIKLYAVWKANTYTVSLPTGQGYSINAAQSTTVDYNGSFTFTVTVAREYAQEPPVVTVTSGGGILSTPTRTPNGDQSVSYTYTISGITADQIVSVSVSQNLMFTVTFEAPVGMFYAEQQVEQGSIATRPADPVVKGFTFDGWYKTNTGWDAADKWDFANNKVTTDTTLYAKLDPIYPEITWPSPTTGYTIAVTGTAPDGTLLSPTNGGPVPYNSVVTFTITIDKGYDASKMQVGINGVLHSPKEINGDTYTFEFTAKENTKITVVGVERKTITITYYDNARDDTSNPLAPQIANYYVENAADNSTFTKQAPVRTGYTFLGWSTDGTAKEATYKWADINSFGGLTIKFTKDTALYAIWTADALTAELIITDEFTSAGSTTSVGGKLEYAYEGDSITLVGKLSADAQGTMTFYKKAKTATDWTFLGTTSINGGNYGVLGTTVENYKWGNADDTTTKNNYRWEYKVEFKPTTDEGYSPCGASDDLRVYSKAISWEVDKKTDTTTYNWISYSPPSHS